MSNITLISKKFETEDVVSFVFKPTEPIKWSAGQFMILNLPHNNPDKKGMERYFTISAAPFEKNLQITTRLTGSTFKTALNDLAIGSELDMKEIDGDFTLDNPSGEYVFIAGGIGITPFRSILQQLSHDQKTINATLIYGNRNQEVVFKKELDSLASINPNLQIKYLTAPDQIDEANIRSIVTDLSKPTFYISGPEPMVEALEKLFLEKLGVIKDRLKTDFFPGYDDHNF